jgi:hypothetical protein
MRTQICHRRRGVAALLLFTALAVTAKSQETTNANLPYPVRIELGDAEFAPGDRITIQQVRGTREAIVPGEMYSVDGTYTLSSRDEAELALHVTSSNRSPSPIDPKQTVRIRKGTGTFHLIKTLDREGYLHVSFYAGNSFGGVYFGQGQWVLRNKGWSSLDRSPRTPDADNRGGSNTVSLMGANRALFAYLGDPVEPPVDLDAAYTKEGLSKALEQAAKNAGVALKIVALDDSEFPCLIGVKCEENDFEKVKDQIKKMERYNYTGSVSSHGRFAFNLVPYPAFPSESSQRISRRLMLRQQILFDRTAREYPVP